MLTKKVHYEGKVQGVGFRASVLSLARGFDVTGGVKNLPDGRVELIIRGDEEELADFLVAIRESHLAGHITSVQAHDLDPETAPRFKGFVILE